MVSTFRRSVGLLLAVLLLSGTRGAAGQDSFALEAQGGMSVGAYEQARTGVDMNPKPAFGGRVEYRPSSLLGVYGGYSYARFGCTGGFCGGGGVSFTSSGAVGGLRFGLLDSSGGLWVRAGATYQRLRSTATGDYEFTSDWGLGFETGIGMTVRLSSALALTPELTYTRYSVTNDAGGTSAVVTINGRVGLQLSF